MARSKGAQNAEKRAAIVRASADLIDKVGYHGASMQLLADAVGLGKPTLYHYFRGKQDILFAIHQDLVGNLLETLEERGSEGLAPDALLRALCFDVLTLIRDHPGYMKALIEHIDELDGEQAEEARKGRLRYLKRISDIVADGIKSGIFIDCDPRIAAFGFIGMCNWAYKWFPGEKKLSVAKIADQFCAIYLDGLKRV